MSKIAKNILTGLVFGGPALVGGYYAFMGDVEPGMFPLASGFTEEEAINSTAVGLTSGALALYGFGGLIGGAKIGYSGGNPLNPEEEPGFGGRLIGGFTGAAMGMTVVGLYGVGTLEAGVLAGDALGDLEIFSSIIES